MNINVYGMGYVGCVSAACLAREGHQVTGIDIDDTKLGLINDGKSPIVEAEIEDIVHESVNSGRLRAGRDPDPEAAISIVCVGTPSNDNGSLGLHYLFRVAEQIGAFLKGTEDFHVVNLRSTVLPGTVEGKVIPILEECAGKKAGPDFGVCMNPEFMREATSVRDFYEPSFTLIGQLDERSGDVAAQIYESVRAPLYRTEIKVAEIVKYACNAFHALKVTFANEIGNACKRLEIDGHEVMELFCRDEKLNLSSYYLKPGFAYGGSCLPKDLRALLYLAKQLDLEVPVLDAIPRSNQLQVQHAFEMIQNAGKKKVGVLGMSFKAGTDDLRESPMVELIERMLGKGYEIRIYDREVSVARIMGANRRYIEQVIPHVSSLMNTNMAEVVDWSEIVLIGNNSPEFVEALQLAGNDKHILDLVGIATAGSVGDGYHGICW